ncbi:carbohydrate binding family 9 domain-containing protein [Dyadobacter chenwenxiniae]|uniref:carbohydrate binding family 9 domain-containing protein n=1 Tax=Dyadobacter chenwenxiniae TaxID=2906456 RepID=UPI001FD0C39D|nr:carbohydrate binding family 9 domain-containing protein [Dyadobacter chenwenxiniae]UON80648.1 carbohydrate binding family 9 domain-containing protein [Dyadobacter chenwenxiniae]
MRKISILNFIFFCLIISKSIAQKPNEKYQYNIHSATSSVNIDGVADDLAWESPEIANNFFMITPMDTSFSRALTDVKMCYDKENLYILVVNYKPVKGSIIVESLKRDFSFGKNDNFLLFMDTFDDKTNGFSFGANAAGAPWDGQQGDGGTVDLSWDNKWVSAVKNDDDKWVWEARYPIQKHSLQTRDHKMGYQFQPSGPDHF